MSSADPVNPVKPVNLWSEPAWAQRYLSERDDLPHRMEGFAVLLELLPAAPRRVLDLGTGDGYTLGLVRSVHPGVEGVGVDFSAEMLGRARERFAGDRGVEIVDHNLDVSLPALGTFDLVVSSFAIHHCVDARKRALYGEVFDVLEAGGRFLHLEHVASATPELHVDFLAAIGKTPAEDDPSNKLVAVDTQLAWLREIGFQQVDCLWKWREVALLAGVKPA
ncbi:MAG TPA: class I SAM-dependent methyltransferase [Acidimicrobiia bacterium]|nr:class I SAM-dependent methyltransferase [Acidimicrobiia bacterium]